MLYTDVITSETELARLIPEWTALCREADLRVPVKTPDWCLTWWSHFRRESWRARDDLRVYAIRDEGGRLRGVAPMVLTSRPGIGPIATRELQFFGADPYVTQLRGPVARSEDLAAVTATLAARIAFEPGVDWVQWRGVPEAQMAARLADTVGFQPISRLTDIDYFIPVSGPWERFRDALPKRTRKALRKCANDLKAEGITPEMRVITAPAEVDAALAIFFDLHQRRAEAPDVAPHPNVYATPRARDFLTDYCRRHAAAGGLRIFQLVVAGEVIATRIGFAYGDQVYLYFSGYDPAWGRLGVMTSLIVDIIRWAIDEGVAMLNLSSGTDRSKTRWLPGSVTLCGGYTHAPGLFSRLTYRLMLKLRYRHGIEPAGDAEEAEPESAEGRSEPLGLGHPATT